MTSRMTQEQIERWANFLNEGYGQFILRATKRGQGVPSRAEYAAWLGIKAPTLSSWTKGKREPSPDHVDVIATKLGMEAYEITGLPPRVPKSGLFKKIAENWSKLTDAQTRHVEEMVANFVEDNEVSKTPRKNALPEVDYNPK